MSDDLLELKGYGGKVNMGIRPEVTVQLGYKPTKSELKKIYKIDHNIGVEVIEKLIEIANTGNKLTSYSFSLDPFIKRDKEGRAIEPFVPIWTKEQKEDLLLRNDDCYDMEIDFFNMFPDKNKRENKDISFLRRVTIPYEDYGLSIIGISCSGDNRGVQETDWAIAEVLKAQTKDKVISLKGKLPWEIGIEKLNGLYHSVRSDIVFGFNTYKDQFTKKE